MTGNHNYNNDCDGLIFKAHNIIKSKNKTKVWLQWLEIVSNTI